MMGEGQHIIQQRVLDFRVADQSTADAVFDHLGENWSAAFGQVEQQLFDAQCSGGETLVLDRLEVSLGTVKPDSPPETLQENYLMALDLALKEIVKHEASGGSAIARDPAHDPKLASLVFLQTGLMPWWYKADVLATQEKEDKHDPSALKHAFLRLCMDSPQLVRTWFEGLATQQQNVFVRCELQFGAEGLRSLLALVESSMQDGTSALALADAVSDTAVAGVDLGKAVKVRDDKKIKGAEKKTKESDARESRREAEQKAFSGHTKGHVPGSENYLLKTNPPYTADATGATGAADIEDSAHISAPGNGQAGDVPAERLSSSDQRSGGNTATAASSQNGVHHRTVEDPTPIPSAEQGRRKMADTNVGETAEKPQTEVSREPQVPENGDVQHIKASKQAADFVGDKANLGAATGAGALAGLNISPDIGETPRENEPETPRSNRASKIASEGPSAPKNLRDAEAESTDRVQPKTQSKEQNKSQSIADPPERSSQPPKQPGNQPEPPNKRGIGDSSRGLDSSVFQADSAQSFDFIAMPEGLAPSTAPEWQTLVGAPELAVENAGTILLWPFLPTLFKNMNWLGETGWITPERAHKAAHMIHFMATGDRDAPEQDMALNKILCGMDITEPIARKVDFSSAEINEGEALLEAVCQHWPQMRGTSTEGLRSTFLCRVGLLSENNERWLLRLEPAPYDMLLEGLPWSYSTVMLSWMKKMLEVEW